jgi:hypothetical protein
MKVAALFVEEFGPYSGHCFIEIWFKEKDARKYEGPWPVIAHPPCERWGRYWSGGPSAKVRRKLGDDNGCFWSALNSVRRYGGVLEHPEASHAWKYYGLNKPPREGGWIRAGDGWGWTCCVEQGHYGHRARKATWLYTRSEAKPKDLIWGPSQGDRLDEGFHSAEERRLKRAMGQKPIKRLSVKENLHTPIAFRDLLIEITTGSQPAEKK